MNRKTYKILWFLVKKFFACAPGCGKIFMSRKVDRELKIERVFESFLAVQYTSGADHSAHFSTSLSRQLASVL